MNRPDFDAPNLRPVKDRIETAVQRISYTIGTLVSMVRSQGVAYWIVLFGALLVLGSMAIGITITLHQLILGLLAYNLLRIFLSLIALFVAGLVIIFGAGIALDDDFDEAVEEHSRTRRTSRRRSRR